MKDCQAKHFESQRYTACWCPECDQVKVKCGNVLLPFKTKQVEPFLTFLEDMYKRQISEQKKKSVQFKFAELSFTFMADELEDLTDLLRMVKIEIQREQLEALFYSGERHIA